MQRRPAITKARAVRGFDPIAADVRHLAAGMVNVYALTAADGSWVLVDTGFPGKADMIEDAAAASFGAGRGASAIILTHAHFDHAGSATGLATRWDAPVYAHPLELPFLDGRSDYPPADPTVGGALALITRFHKGPSTTRASVPVRALPEDGSIPGCPEWRWVHTPGHTPGHVSLWRARDRTLVAGDAFTTIDSDSFTAMILRRVKVCRPGTPTTYDWTAAARSVAALAALRPRTLACGHGTPLRGLQASGGLGRLTARFPHPKAGRYAAEPATFDADGTRFVPPPVPDPLPSRAAIGALGLIAAGALLWRNRRKGA